MIRRPPRSTRTDTLFPYTTLFRSMLVFAWRYRQSNKEATYDPEWSHSTQLELVIWSVPLLIIVALGALTWIGTHTLDPYRPIERLDSTRPIDADAKTLQEIGRAHVCTPVTNAHLVCRLLLVKHNT